MKRRDVRHWPKADMLKNAIDVAFVGKADMGLILNSDFMHCR